MARKPSVTRTLKTTECDVLCLNLESAEPFNQTVVLPRTYKDEKKLMKAVSDMVDTDTVKAVHIVNTNVVEQLYGMSEDEFLKYAKPMPPRKTGNSSEENA